MKISSVLAASLLSAAISTSASAASFGHRVDAPGPGRWTVTYQFDQRGSGTVDFWEKYNANVYEIPSGNYAFGYDQEYDKGQPKVFTNTDRVSFVLRVENQGEWYGWGPELVERFDYSAWGILNGEFATAPKWTTTTSYLGAVPEPATWAMMIIGFGAVGSTVRKRRRSGLAAA